GHRSRLPFPALCSAACAAPRRFGNGSDTATLRWDSVRDQPGPRCQDSARSDTHVPLPPLLPPRPEMSFWAIDSHSNKKNINFFFPELVMGGGGALGGSRGARQGLSDILGLGQGRSNTDLGFDLKKTKFAD